MNNTKFLQILSVAISTIGVGYMGYTHGKGLDNNYGFYMVLFGLMLSIAVLLFGKKDKK